MENHQAMMQSGPAHTPQPNPDPIEEQHQPPQRGQEPTPATQGRQTIWEGVFEWNARGNGPRVIRMTADASCKVSTNINPDSWPSRMSINFMSNRLFDIIRSDYVRNSTIIWFHPTPCEAVESFTEILTTGFVGYIGIAAPSYPNELWETLYMFVFSVEGRRYKGVIPNNQVGFKDHLSRLAMRERAAQRIREEREEEERDEEESEEEEREEEERDEEESEEEEREE